MARLDSGEPQHTEGKTQVQVPHPSERVHRRQSFPFSAALKSIEPGTVLLSKCLFCAFDSYMPCRNSTGAARFSPAARREFLPLRQP